jgi:hypothetical protein
MTAKKNILLCSKPRHVSGAQKFIFFLENQASASDSGNFGGVFHHHWCNCRREWESYVKESLQ